MNRGGEPAKIALGLLKLTVPSGSLAASRPASCVPSPSSALCPVAERRLGSITPPDDGEGEQDDQPTEQEQQEQQDKLDQIEEKLENGAEEREQGDQGDAGSGGGTDKPW